eukprot:238245-Chlamydomonas_euryale.AAC.1
MQHEQGNKLAGRTISQLPRITRCRGCLLRQKYVAARKRARKCETCRLAGPHWSRVCWTVVSPAPSPGRKRLSGGCVIGAVC